MNYLLNLHDKQKSKRVLHVNMPKEWCISSGTTYFAQENEEENDEGPTWKDSKEGGVWFGAELTEEQQCEVEKLLGEFTTVMYSTPGSTTLAEHPIKTGDARLVRLPPYQLPQAYRKTVEQQLQDMLAHGITEPSSSDSASPIMLARKKDGSLRLCVDYRRP